MRSALILAGGRGERFWPWSRPGLPKQLLPLADGKILLLATLERLEGIVPPEATWILTSREIAPRMQSMVGKRARIVEEPVGRNTAPAIGYAALLSEALGAHDGMAVLAADHLIPDLEDFRKDLDAALTLAEDGDRLVTFGIRPTRPDPGFGYVEKGAPLGPERAFKVLAFREKPDLATAREYLASGRHFWNSGMFAWRPRAILEGLERLPAASRQAVFRRVRRGPLPQRVPIRDEEPDAQTRGILVAAQEVFFRPQDIQNLRLEQYSSARLPSTHRTREAVETFPDRHCLTR